MITILTTTKHTSEVETYITSIERLNEIVYISETEANKFPVRLKIIENNIKININWEDETPPYRFPPMPLTRENLLALTYFHLGNHQKAFEFINKNNPLYHHLLLATNLQLGYFIEEKIIEKNKNKHNQCIIQHYGNIENRWNYETLCNAYELAIQNETDPQDRAFTLKHYSNLLLDVSAFAKAEKHLISQLKTKLCQEAEIALKTQLASSLLGQLQIPYNANKLETISKLQNECLSYLKNKKEPIKEGLICLEAAEIASFKGEYIQAKTLLNKAIANFRQEDIPELLGEASLRKAILLYTWSKNGSPQYYKPAINAFQDTLKVFKRHSHPNQFADIHHNLALIYSEIPVSLEEKPIWVAFCASSFKEALAIYKKETHPYKFAMTCHNYATALMSFPEAKLHNNLNKAFDLFENALSVRTAEDYPFERALSLLNQIELMWLIHNETDKEEIENLELMIKKANEIKYLVNDPTLINKAQEQIIALENLKKILV